LATYVPRYTEGLSTNAVVHAGPLAIDRLSSSADTVHGIRLAYSKAIQNIMIFSLAIVCISILAASGMRWVNVVKVSQAREALKAAGQRSYNMQDSTEKKPPNTTVET
jgi:hypothetical protein